MRRAGALALFLLPLAACAPGLTASPENPPPPPAPPEARLMLNEEGIIVAEADPYARRALRRADHDLQATTIARGVTLVAEPAEGAPVYVSNLLNAALARRFGGHLPVKDALAAPVVFLIRPVVSEEALTAEGRIIVDWLLRTETGEPVGVVYAARRLTGAMERGDPWTAVSPADAEHVAIQTAANILEAPAIREALARGAVDAAISRTPSPTPRPKRAEPPSAAPPAAAPPAPRPAG